MKRLKEDGEEENGEAEGAKMGRKKGKGNWKWKKGGSGEGAAVGAAAADAVIVGVNGSSHSGEVAGPSTSVDNSEPGKSGNNSGAKNNNNNSSSSTNNNHNSTGLDLSDAASSAPAMTSSPVTSAAIEAPAPGLLEAWNKSRATRMWEQDPCGPLVSSPKSLL